MNTIKVVVGNSYLHGIKEDFYCSEVDVSDLQEMEYCADECCGQYLDMHGDIIHALCPDLSWENIAEACYYLIEEVHKNEF